jgi:hypothetical protein
MSFSGTGKLFPKPEKSISQVEKSFSGAEMSFPRPASRRSPQNPFPQIPPSSAAEGSPANFFAKAFLHPPAWNPRRGKAGPDSGR